MSAFMDDNMALLSKDVIVDGNELASGVRRRQTTLSGSEEKRVGSWGGKGARSRDRRREEGGRKERRGKENKTHNANSLDEPEQHPDRGYRNEKKCGKAEEKRTHADKIDTGPLTHSPPRSKYLQHPVRSTSSSVPSAPNKSYSTTLSIFTVEDIAMARVDGKAEPRTILRSQRQCVPMPDRQDLGPLLPFPSFLPFELDLATRNSDAKSSNDTSTRGTPVRQRETRFWVKEAVEDDVEAGICAPCQELEFTNKLPQLHLRLGTAVRKRGKPDLHPVSGNLLCPWCYSTRGNRAACHIHPMAVIPDQETGPWGTFMAIDSNVGTEGATKNFLIWTHFGIRNQFPHISLISRRITTFYGSFFWNNYSAISDRARFPK
ncbi:hypothetical protein K438DRAFT_1770095 [Mycena galopus ATCC 62051]|nr:hypothetical protein K438DRAFT_1770095 [Mycena galopus ATCC 62051]